MFKMNLLVMIMVVSHILLWPTAGSILFTHVLWYGGHVYTQNKCRLYSHWNLLELWDTVLLGWFSLV